MKFVTLKRKFRKPRCKFLYPVYHLLEHSWFDHIIQILILLNTIILCLEYETMNSEYQTFLEIANITFAFVFNLEAILKIVGYQWQYFWYSNWDRFDFVVILGTDIGLCVALITNSYTVVKVIKLFRVLRIFRLIRTFGSIVIETLKSVLPQMLNILSLIILLYFIFAVLGIQLFSTVRYRTHYNEDFNFRSVGSTFLLLLRCTTGEGWQLIMHDLADSTDCDRDQSNEALQQDGINGCGGMTSYIYWVVFQIIFTIIVLNLSISAMIHALAQSSKEHDGAIKKSDIDNLVKVWSYYDPHGTGFI